MSVYTKPASFAPALPLSGTALALELGTFLQAQHYTTQARTEALLYIEAHGTAFGSEVLETVDADECDLIIRNRLGNVEYEDASQWPACFDSERWGPTDAVDFPAHTEPANGPLPSEAYLAPDLEPSFEDRVWFASQGKVDPRRVPATVTIRGLSYGLATNPDAYWTSFRLTSPVGKVYDVAETPDGPACDCPDFVFRRDGVDPAGCKHVRALVECGLIHPALPAVCGGAPAPEPRWDDAGGVRSRQVTGWTDADQQQAHGVV